MTREEAIENIKKALPLSDTLAESFYTLHPELRESEDERIRKEIVGAIQKHYPNTPESYRWISWLEKQKERGPLTKEEEYTLHRIIEYLEDETCPSEWINLLHDIYCLPYEKQKETGIRWFKSDNVKNPDKPYIDKAGMFYTTDGRMCHASDIEKQKDILSERATNITANMLEDGIEGIQRELIEFLSNTINAPWINVIKSADAYAQRIRSMVEKQKEQKPVKCELEDAFKYYTDAGITISCEDIVAKPKEQKPEPVFKVGDKIRLKSELNYPYREIVDIKNGAYYFDEAVYLPFDNQDNWEKEQKHILKFKVGDKVHLEGDDVNILTITGIEEDRYLTDNSYGPILFGAEDIWEIVEQKPADLPAGFYVTLPDGEKYYTKEMRCNGMNVKVVEPKPAEWSEEDEENFKWFDKFFRAESVIAGGRDIPQDKYLWFKSLRPSWKPSEEQMSALNYFIKLWGNSDDQLEYTQIFITVKSLYEQLKKL